MTDFRALCAELAAELDHNRRCLLDDATLTHPLADRARAALSEPVAEPPAVTERPSDEELRDLWSWAAGQDQGPWPTQQHAFARAVLARWGQPPAPPAEGEVAALVADLRRAIDDAAAMGWLRSAQIITRAAELLERLAAPVPVPTFRDAIQLAQGCHDYSGGYGGTPCAEAFHTGIGTVVNVLTKAASGPWDHQTKAVFAVGADLPLPAPQGGEVEL